MNEFLLPKRHSVENNDDPEACYWCRFIVPDSTETMTVTGWCNKHHKRVDMEQEGCADFALYESLMRMVSGKEAREFLCERTSGKKGEADEA